MLTFCHSANFLLTGIKLLFNNLCRSVRDGSEDESEVLVSVYSFSYINFFRSPILTSINIEFDPRTM